MLSKTKNWVKHIAGYLLDDDGALSNLSLSNYMLLIVFSLVAFLICL